MQIHTQTIGRGIIQQTQTMCKDCHGRGEYINPKDRCKICNGNKVSADFPSCKIHWEESIY